MTIHCIFLPGEILGQKNLVGYDPRGPKDLDTAELDTTVIYIYTTPVGGSIYIYTTPVGGTVVKNPPADAGDTRDTSLTHGSGSSSGVGMATHSSLWGSKRVIYA